jgi:uncharacterized membrane protein
MLSTLRHIRRRPSLLVGMAVAVPVVAIAAVWLPIGTALLVGWNAGVIAYVARFLVVIRRSTVATIAAALASLGAIVAELARVHGHPDAGWTEALAGTTVLLSWVFIHMIFATHYAHEFWRRDGGLTFPGNAAPGYMEFLYFSFCIAVASQVSDVSTQSAAMRRIVLLHSLIAYLFNTAVIALGVNIAASLAS